jgi:hypothetical protein
MNGNVLLGFAALNPTYETTEISAVFTDNRFDRSAVEGTIFIHAIPEGKKQGRVLFLHGCYL